MMKELNCVPARNENEINNIYILLKKLDAGLAGLDQTNFGIEFRVAILMMKNAIKLLKPFF